MVHDYEKIAKGIKQDAKEFGSRASDAYHEHVPVHKRPAFWALFIIVCLIVASVVGFLLPG